MTVYLSWGHQLAHHHLINIVLFSERFWSFFPVRQVASDHSWGLRPAASFCNLNSGCLGAEQLGTETAGERLRAGVFGGAAMVSWSIRLQCPWNPRRGERGRAEQRRVCWAALGGTPIVASSGRPTSALLRAELGLQLGIVSSGGRRVTSVARFSLSSKTPRAEGAAGGGCGRAVQRLVLPSFQAARCLVAASSVVVPSPSR